MTQRGTRWVVRPERLWWLRVLCVHMAELGGFREKTELSGRNARLTLPECMATAD